MPEITHVEIAANHDNTGGLAAFAELDPPNFWAYELGVKVTWNSEETTRIDGNMRRRRTTPPWVFITMQRVTEEEAGIIDGLEGPVTINVRMKNGGAWKIYNGQLWSVTWGDFAQHDGIFEDVRFEIHALVETS